MEREDLPDLLAFSVIVSERSFRSAAAKLGVSPSALSHAIRRLEGKLGTALLRRTTRSIAPTDTGLHLLKSLKPAFEEIDRGLLDLAGRRDRIAGPVRINVHRTAAELLILPKLRRLQTAYPELQIELSIDDGLTDVVAAGCDAGVRNGEQVAKDMIAVRISNDFRTAVVAAPSYLKGRPTLETPEDLHEHRCIGYRFVTSKILHRWRFEQYDRILDATYEPCLIVDDVYMAGRAAIHGLGLSYVLREAVADHLQSGDLVEVLHDWSTTITGDFLYYPSRRTLSPAMRIIVDHLRYSSA